MRHPSFSLTTIGSGSQGNALLLEAGPHLFLLDAGLSFRRIKQTFSDRGWSWDRLAGIFLTHDHDDHLKGLRLVLRHHVVPVYATKGTLQSAQRRGIEIRWPVPLRRGQEIDVNGIRCWPFATPHDASEPVGFRFERQGSALTLASDLGHITPEIVAHCRDLDLLAIESNYDEDLLTGCGYPDWLKHRIRGPRGHLANEGIAGILRRLTCPLDHLLLVHLSQESNTPERAQAALTPLLDLPQLQLATVTVADQDQAGPTLTIGGSRASSLRSRLTRGSSPSGPQRVQHRFDFEATG
jgi:phosphoribosyl 1,2-cyclic phosphodiesterase